MVGSDMHWLLATLVKESVYAFKAKLLQGGSKKLVNYLCERLRMLTPE